MMAGPQPTTSQAGDRRIERLAVPAPDDGPAGQAIDAIERSRKALRSSEARFCAMADNIATLVLIAGVDGHVVWYNRRWRDYCGVTSLDMENRGWQAVHDPVSLPAARERWRIAIAGAVPFEISLVLNGSDGICRSFLMRMLPFRDDGGQITHWVGSHTDMAEPGAAEANNARLAAIVASSNDAIISFDAKDGRIMTWNKGAEHLFGYTEAQAVGGPVSLIVPAELPEGEPSGVFAWAMAGRPVVEHETTRTTSGGVNIPVSVTAARMLSPDGRIIGVSAIFRDLRPRLRVEEALRESEQQLRQAQKLEAIGRLAAGVAHDFNNVLQSVSGGLEIVLDEVEADTLAYECAEVALGAARRGAYLTNHLLSYARKQMLQPTRVEIAPYLTEMQKVLARTLGPHIVIEVRTQNTTPSILVDPGQLQTALLNLAINASHAMARGGTLTLDTRQERDPSGRQFVVVAVRDTGVGMDKATMAQAFEPFFTTKGLDGTGLGLSMVQGFAVQSGGAARISSSPGHGTVVELWFPPATEPSDRSRSSAGGRAARNGSGRILLVDDVAEVLTTVAILLEKSGYQVARASGGGEALALVAAGERFDVLVSDYAMPGLNGVELIEQARSVQPGLSALIITGFAEPAGSDPLPAGVTVLRKPFQRQQLVDTILQALALHNHMDG